MILKIETHSFITDNLLKFRKKPLYLIFENSYFWLWHFKIDPFFKFLNISKFKT